MSGEIAESLGNFLLYLLFILVLADIILRPTWNKKYFTIGVPVFIMRIPVNVRHKGIPFQYLLEEEFQDDWLVPFTFKQIDSSTYAFREKYFQFFVLHYFPIMHGLINFERGNGYVEVKGIASLFTTWFLIYTILVMFNFVEVFPMHSNWYAIILLALGICYAIQYFRFSKVCKIAAHFWAEKHFSMSNGA